MDMKRILQAMDSVATKPVVGVNDMSKFVSIVKQNDVSILNEGANPHKVSLPVQMAMQHYQKEEPIHKPVGRDSVIRKYFKEVEEELTAQKTEKRQLINQYASIIAERVLMKESLDEACWDKYKQVGMKKKGRKMVPNCVPKEGVAEDEIPGHSMGFTGGVGPGAINNVIDEMPIEFNKENPIQSQIKHKSNPGSIEYRIMRARSQIKDLAARVDSNELIVWEGIARQFPELAMNIEEIRHGIEELAKIRKGGGRRSHNIDKRIGEAVMPAIKASKPTAPKIVKPKAKTSVCRAGQTQTGTQIKNGVSVPKCSVTSVKKKVAEDNIGYLPKVATDAGGIAVSTAMLSTIWNKLLTPVFGDFKYYTYLDLINDLGIVSASFIAGALTGPETLGAGAGLAIVRAWPAVERLASVLSKAIKALRLFLPDVPSMILAIKKLAPALYKLDAAELGRFASILVKDGLPAAAINIGVNFGMEKLDKALDDMPDEPEFISISGKQAARNQRDALRKFDTPGNPSPYLHPERYPTQ